LIKSIKLYSSTKGTLREEICSRIINSTTQVYLGNMGLLHAFSRVAQLSKHVYNKREGPTLSKVLML
jgi:hypothetical protein